MKNLKNKKQQLKKLLGKHFNHTIINLISIVNEDDEYQKKGEIQSCNQHFLPNIFYSLNKHNGYIDGWEIPFEEYEIELVNVMDKFFQPIDIKMELEELEKEISKILKCKIHQRKKLLENV